MPRFHKIIPWIALLMGMIILVTTTFAQEGGLSLSWFTIDAGGGTSMSSDSIYTLHDTIGQLDTQLMTGGSFELSGGFWKPNSPGNRPSEAGDIMNFLPIISKFFQQIH